MFAFDKEIQDGRPKWQENNFWVKLPVDFADTLRGNKFCQNRSISHCFLDKCVFAFYTEIQDGLQKWPENDLGKL